MIDNILTTYQIETHHDFLFLEKENLAEFMAWDLSPHSHNYYILSFLYEGKITHLSDFKKDIIDSPAILMLDVDQIHIHPDISNCKVVSIAFSQDFISDQQYTFLQKINKIFVKTLINISTEELDRLDEIIKIIARENLKENQDYDLIKALLGVLIVYCDKLIDIHSPLDQNSNTIYNRFKTLLKQNFKKQHLVKFYADQLNVSTSVLKRYVKNTTNKTPKELIDDHLLLEAKRLLYWSNVSVKEISWQLGFDTDSYFNRFFKKYTGKTPKEFQKNHVENKVK